MGIKVYHGVAVDFEKSTIGSDIPIRRVLLKSVDEAIGPDISTKIVCDATGFSRKLSGKFKKKEFFEG